MKETYSTDNQKTFYGNEQIELFQCINKYLFYLYWILFIGLSFVTINKKLFNIDIKVNKVIKGINIRKVIDVIDGWVYIDLSIDDIRELKLNNILTK